METSAFNAAPKRWQAIAWGSTESWMTESFFGKAGAAAPTVAAVYDCRIGLGSF
jgi:hypothetical protein